MFKIDIASLSPGIHELAFEPEPEDIELDAEKFDDIEVDARLDVQEGRILVMLQAAAKATLVCDRTLELFDQRIGGSYHVLFAPPEFVEHQEEAFDEVRVLQPTDLQLDLTDVVRDTILLSIPQRCVAPGAEEEELETEFGAPEDEMDPRWEALAKLRSGASEN